jgi:hypothetical protein
VANELNNKGLKVKVSETASDYLSCDLKIDQTKKLTWIGQTTLLRKVIKTISHLTTRNYKYNTPGTPNQHIHRPTDEDKSLTPEEKTPGTPNQHIH